MVVNAESAYEGGNPQTVRGRALRRLQALKTEASPWRTKWKDIARFEHPYLGRFNVTDRNMAAWDDGDMIDNTPMYASGVLAAGFMGGVTSPARPWFRAGLKDPDLMERQAVKQWCHDTTSLILSIFAASNVYRSLHQTYEELGLFATSATILDPDFDTVIHASPLTIGEYYLSANAKGVVDTMYREFQMTVEQMIGKFGYDKVSDAVRNLYDRGSYDTWVDVVHFIEPRKKRDLKRAHVPRHMAFASTYIDPADHRPDAVLLESGRKRFPVLAPRWATVGRDTYGSNNPGMRALGDSKSLQAAHIDKAEAMDYRLHPPLQIPSKLRDNPSARLPGGSFYVDNSQASMGIRSAWEVNIRTDELLADIADQRERVNRAFFVQLFLMAANDDRSGTTATEIAERHEEKLLMIGPVLERLNSELLEPLIDITFDYAAEAGILPPIPSELQGGEELEIEFINVLSQAQKIVATRGNERFIQGVATMAQIEAASGKPPSVLKKVDFLQAADELAAAYGADPRIVVSDDVINKQLADEQRMAQMQQMAAAAQPTAQYAKAAKDVSGVDTDNAQQVLTQLMGYGSPSPQEV